MGNGTGNKYLVFQDPLADISQISLGEHKANISPDVGKKPENHKLIMLIMLNLGISRRPTLSVLGYASL